MAMIEVEHLTRRYGTTTAIEELAFRVERGEIVGFLGPNGAGKSTTMRILCGSLGATSGSARVAGFDVAEQPAEVKRRIGYLPEHPPLYTEMTVEQYLAFCARLKGVPSPRQAAEKAAERVGLATVSHRIIGNLSKGYRQRVGIAQALVHEPEVLVLDEPNSGLDPAQRAEIRALIEQLAAGETTVLLSTHVLPEIEALCDRVIILNKGRIVAQDTVAALGSSEHRIRIEVEQPSEALQTSLQAIDGVTGVQAMGDGVYVVSTEGDQRAEIARCAVPFGLVHLGADRRLEDVFLQLTGGMA